jgi:hypothetical protein
MARDAKISLQPDQTLAEVNEVEISHLVQSSFSDFNLEH